MPNSEYLYDDHHVRYQLLKTNPGTAVPNWLFFPGGPGMDSSCFTDLVTKLDVPGNFWLIDLPANGSNISELIPADYDFEQWPEYFLASIQKFANPIYVGHSFGGMFPLLFPQLEDILTGLVILNSAPCFMNDAWLEAAANCVKEKNLPALDETTNAFTSNPNQDTYKTALSACTPYLFTEKSMDQGKAFLERIPMNYHASCWWLKKTQAINFNAQWIPSAVPTLIVGASDDFMTPSALFENDTRFHRKNISLKIIKNAGHFPWFEDMAQVKALFNALSTDILKGL